MYNVRYFLFKVVSNKPRKNQQRLNLVITHNPIRIKPYTPKRRLNAMTNKIGSCKPKIAAETQSFIRESLSLNNSLPNIHTVYRKKIQNRRTKPASIKKTRNNRNRNQLHNIIRNTTMLTLPQLHYRLQNHFRQHTKTSLKPSQHPQDSRSPLLDTPTDKTAWIGLRKSPPSIARRPLHIVSSRQLMHAAHSPYFVFIVQTPSQSPGGGLALK